MKVAFESQPSPADVQHVVETVQGQKDSHPLLSDVFKKFFTKSVSYNDAASPTPQQPSEYDVKDRGIKVNDSDLKELTNVLMNEVGNRSSDKISLEAKTIINTALNRMKEYAAKGQPMSLTDVLHMPGQYQGYLPNGVKNLDGKLIKSEYQKAAAGEIDSVTKPKYDAVQSVVGQLKTGSFQDNTNGAFYYKHDPTTAEIHYDDKTPLFSGAVATK